MRQFKKVSKREIKKFFKKALTSRIEFGIIENVKSGAYTRCLSKRDNKVKTEATNNKSIEDMKITVIFHYLSSCSEDHA